MNTLKFLTSVLLFLSITAGKHVFAHDFSVTVSGGNKLFLNITDTLKKSVEITYEGSITAPQRHLPQGTLYIPEIVKHENRDYRVVSVGPKAFSRAIKLERIVLPASISKIEAFAFEGCTGLKSVVYPGSPVVVEEGAFFGCDKIETVSFGSDWTAVNVAPYVWSDSLKEIEIPAKVKKLTNLKELRNLEKVYVSIHNPAYSSRDGLLYSKDAKTLYACPCAYRGVVVVPEGTENILEGAFRDCWSVENIDLPASVKRCSYSEFLRTASLKSILLRAMKPISTAKHEGKEVFALRLPSPEVLLYVPKAAYNAYCDAVCHESGEYEDIHGKQGRLSGETGFATKENIRKIR